ncbi:hypothetical protein F4782DRAFT_414030 [Xylaria castorea]|nr:hypothetical protein F4782DRAFT_414030 [Xylaria castorea]
MSSQGDDGPDLPILLDGLDPMQPLEDHLHALLFPLPRRLPADVLSPFHHGPSTNLLEIQVVLPSVSYLRLDNGTYFGSVPRDVLESYASRAIADAESNSAILTSPPSPHRSAWWMAGDVLRLIGDSLDHEVIRWWETARRDDNPPQPPSTNGQATPFGVFSSDRFSLAFRTLDHRVSNPEAGGNGPAVDRTSAAAYEKEISRLVTEIERRQENASQQDGTQYQILKDLEITQNQLRQYEKEAAAVHREEAAARLREEIEKTRELEETVLHLETTLHARDDKILDLTAKLQRHDPGKSSTSGGEVTALQARLDEAERTNEQHLNHIAKLRDIIRRFEYATMKNADLSKECKARGLDVPSNAVKATFVDALVLNDNTRHVLREPTQSEIDNGVAEISP